MRILIVEDDARLAGVVQRGLIEGGHSVQVEHDGARGLAAASAREYDAIVLDLLLPRLGGLALLRELRARSVRTPVLILTSRDTAGDTVEGLDAGADDYLRKPFVFAELEARLRSITRRHERPRDHVLAVGNLSLEQASRRVRRGGTPIELTARETALLEFLMLNAGLIVTRRMIEDAVWPHDHDTESNVIEVYIRRLRAKLSPRDETSPIKTIRGAGYRFEG